MGKRIRITRKLLKEDEVRSYWVHVLEWAHQNSKALLIGATAAAVLLLFVAGFRSRVASRSSSANLLLSRAQTEAQVALFVQDDDEREKLFEAARDKLQTIVELYGRNRLASHATYLLGNIAFFRNNYDEAEQHFQRYIEAVKDPVEKADGHIALGYTYENRFFWTPQEADDRVWLERAENQYREAEALTSGTLQHYQALLCRARLYDLEMAQEEKAKELYRRIVAERELDKLELPRASVRNPQLMLLNQLRMGRRLFSLAETARLRLEQLEAGD